MTCRPAVVEDLGHLDADQAAADDGRPHPLLRLAVERLEIAQRHEVVQARALGPRPRRRAAPSSPTASSSLSYAEPRAVLEDEGVPGRVEARHPAAAALEAHPLVERRGRRARCPAGVVWPAKTYMSAGREKKWSCSAETSVMRASASRARSASAASMPATPLPRIT